MVDVAQLVEPRIVIPAVAGSSPVVHPTFDDGCESSSALLEKGFLGPLAQLVEQLTLNQLVVGSIPTRPTISFIQFNKLRAFQNAPNSCLGNKTRVVQFEWGKLVASSQRPHDLGLAAIYPFGDFGVCMTEQLSCAF